MDDRTRCVVAAALGAVATFAAPARALPAPVPHQVVTVAATFVSPEIRILQGDTLTLTNADATLAHDLVSRSVVGGSRLFGSDPAAFGERVEVRRVSSLRPGVYPFICSLHETMMGNLRVEPAPAR